MPMLAAGAHPCPDDLLALHEIRETRKVPLAVQRIRPLNVVGKKEWWELLARPIAGEPGNVMKLAERMACAMELDIIIATHGLRRTRMLGGSISLNVSAQSVSTAGFLPQLVRVVEDSGFDYDRLVLEITETAPITDVRAAVIFAEWMRKQGAKIALDDVTDLRTSLPLACIDTIKIDRALVRVADTDDGRAKLRSIAETARSAGVITVAEGVEHEHQVKLLAMLGYNYYQGFVHEHPTMLV